MEGGTLLSCPINVNLALTDDGGDITIDVEVDGFDLRELASGLLLDDEEGDGFCEGYDFSDVECESDVALPDLPMEGELEDQVQEDDGDQHIRSHKDNIRMSLAADYVTDVIQSVITTAAARHQGRADAHVEGPAQLNRPRSMSASRSRRRIIGAVVRTPSKAALADWSLGPAVPEPQRNAKKHTAAAAVFSTPLKAQSSGAPCGREALLSEHGLLRSSKSGVLATGKEITGMQPHHLIRDKGGKYSASKRQKNKLNDEHTVVFKPVQLIRVPSAPPGPSAMELDIPCSKARDRAGLQNSFGRSDPMPSPNTMSFRVVNKSMSAGSLAITAATEHGQALLPSLSNKQFRLPELSTSTSAGSIAWSMRLSKTGMRKSSSATCF
jgi:hypothetical protein